MANSTRCEAAVQHSPVVIPSVPSWETSTLAEKIRRGWRVWKRFLRLLWHLGPVIFLYPLIAYLSPPPPTGDVHEILLQSNDLPEGWLGWYYEYALYHVEQSGAAVIKLLQWAGSRPDLFGHAFCAVFSRLQDQTTPHSEAYTKRQIERAYGATTRLEILELLGSGCIGQVYRGKVDDTEVAVKILHPNVLDDILADLDLLRFSVQVLRRFSVYETLQWLNPEGVVEEFSRLLLSQLDLRNEARNLERFAENFRDVDWLSFPGLVEQFPASRNVLVESFCQGIPVLDYCRQSNDQATLTDLCRKATKAVCKMIFLDNFIHGTSLSC